MYIYKTIFYSSGYEKRSAVKIASNNYIIILIFSHYHQYSPMNKQFKCLGFIYLFSLFLDVLNLLTPDTNITYIY